MNITIEKFTENHIGEALSLFEREFQEEARHCPDLPQEDFTERLTGVLHWLCGQPYGKAAFDNGRLIGYLIFAGPWEGFFGDVRCVFSPLGGSAFSFDAKDRGRIASLLFESVSQEFVGDGVYSCALSRFAHDADITRSLVLNGFGIRCSDAVRKISELTLSYSSDEVRFSELPISEFGRIRKLRHGLVKHLEKAPIFYPTDMERFDEWFAKEDLRVFIAETKGKTVGLISLDDDAENFITEHSGMKNICGAYFDEKYRGKGIAQDLLAFICDTLRTEEVTHLGVDCETLNPTALNF